MAVNGEVKILPMMYLALSYDHRMIDGKGGGAVSGHHQGITGRSGKNLFEKFRTYQYALIINQAADRN